MHKHIIIAIVLLVLVSARMEGAGKAGKDEERQPWAAGLTASATSDGWYLGAGTAWMPLKWVGVGADVALASPWFESSGYDVDDHGQWVKMTSHSRFLFRPSVIGAWPDIVSVRSWGLDLGLYAITGVTLSPRAHDSRGSGWVYWHFGVGVSATIDRLVITAGYGFSTFDIKDGRREGPLYAPRQRRNTEAFTLGVGWKF